MSQFASPQVSVLIPIWNVEKYIERCLRSVFEQTVADQAEFILVNDCSPDNLARQLNENCRNRH